MRRGLTFTFIVGLLLGGMAALIIWYWQKSTSAEDGALALLDRLAEVDRKLRQQTAVAETSDTRSVDSRIRIDNLKTTDLPHFLQTQNSLSTAEDLTEVKGIGPVFAEKLAAANIQTLQALTAVSVVTLADILQISEGRAANILEAANALQKNQ